MTKRDAPSWSDIAARVATLDKPTLIALVHDLFDGSEANQTFLAARFPAPGDAHAALDAYRRRVVSAVYAEDENGWYGHPDVATARHVIAQYERATADLTGTVDLLLTLVETGTRFTCDLGDIDEGFYADLEGALDHLASRLQTPEGAALYPRFQQRLLGLVELAQGIGWGYGDAVMEYVGELDADLGADDESGSDVDRQTRG